MQNSYFKWDIVVFTKLHIVPCYGQTRPVKIKKPLFSHVRTEVFALNKVVFLFQSAITQ